MLIALNKNENLTTPSTNPNKRISLKLASGRGKKKIAGIATNKNRKADKRNGGKCSKPILITEKFTPQINAQRIASTQFLIDKIIPRIFLCVPHPVS